MMSQILPGFDSFWRKNSRNKVLKWRDEVPFMDITVIILLCLIKKKKEYRYLSKIIRLGSRKENRKVPCLCKLGSPEAPVTCTFLYLLWSYETQRFYKTQERSAHHVFYHRNVNWLNVKPTIIFPTPFHKCCENGTFK